MSWNNNDNLFLKFGTEKTTATKAGEYSNVGQLREIECKITLSALTQAEVILADITSLPAGFIVQEVEVITQVAAATGTAIDVGLIRASDRSTQIDYDGLLAAFPTSQMNAVGERTILTNSSTVPATQTGTGALIGTTLANVGYISASMTDATSFTAGVIIVKIRLFRP